MTVKPDFPGPERGRGSSPEPRWLVFCLLAALLFALPRLSAQDVPRPKITGIAYVRVYVADLHASREFYRSVLGLGGDTMDCIGAEPPAFP